MQTSNIASLLTSKAGWLSIFTGLSVIFTYLAPVVPQPWGALITAVLSIFAYYHIGKTVTAARVAGATGL